jgi:hypothetical protein
MHAKAFSSSMLAILALLNHVEPLSSQDQQKRLPEAHAVLSSDNLSNLLPIGVLVNTGSEEEAEAYYARIDGILQFQIEGSTLDDFVQYLGYRGITAAHFEELPSDLLMPSDSTGFSLLVDAVSSPEFKSVHTLDDFSGGKVLASRFFAPKIVNYNVANPNRESDNPFNPGWRKLVWLSSIRGSSADLAGMRGAYILFNVFEPDEFQDPFRNESVNNQVMVVPRTNSTELASLSDSVFWLLYLTRPVGYSLGYALNVGFDLPSCPEPECVTRDYFVPRACAQCHGHDTLTGELDGAPVTADSARTSIVPTQDMSVGVYAFGKVNYLDTDQWYDMVEYDFPGTARGPYDVLFDGEKGDHGSTRHQRAFGVITQMNVAIEAQNAGSARPDGSDRFKRLAVVKWLDLHRSDPVHVPPIQRGIEVKPGQVWSGGNVNDEPLLTLLNRFCFRCHSSLKWSVFDRSALFENGRKFTIPGFVASRTMPQGRLIEQQYIDELIAYVQTIK